MREEWGEEKSSGRGEELSLKSNNPTPRVGKKNNATRANIKQLNVFAYRHLLHICSDRRKQTDTCKSPKKALGSKACASPASKSSRTAGFEVLSPVLYRAEAICQGIAQSGDAS